MARAMLHNKDVAKDLWGEVVNIACHIVNRVYFRPSTKKIPYELWKGRKPNLKYFRIFGSTCFILKDRENMGKFDTWSDEVGCSSTSKAYSVLNKRNRKVMETINVVINEVSTSKSSKAAKQMPKSVLPLSLGTDQEVGDQDPSPPISTIAIQVLEDSSTSP